VTALEAQARRDAERIAELEKYRAQALQLQEMKESLHTRQKQLEDQLLVQIQMKTNTEAQRDVEMDSMRHTVELTLVDKEIAEEKCHALEDRLLDLQTVLAGMRTVCVCVRVCVCVCVCVCMCDWVYSSSPISSRAPAIRFVKMHRPRC
jgi:hypothetical protein